MKILFVCKGNVGRSQMAEALFRKKFGTQHEVFSAGTQLSGPEEPISKIVPLGRIGPVLDVMNEEGIDLSMVVRKQLTEEMVNTVDTVVVIMEPTEDLPEYLAQSPKMIRWSLPDPKGQDTDFTRNVKDQIKERISQMVVK
ncbi:MAG: hypothetical protein HZA80_03000 [Candidatus Taylorbacteria bacterium]|nr:hypothetical protein [Candidatus Taylorbacteria bacterium]